jgi:hypothetical protein
LHLKKRSLKNSRGFLLPRRTLALLGGAAPWRDFLALKKALAEKN